MREEDILQLAASRTFDADKVWSNPNIRIPLEKAHLSLVIKEANPQEFEMLGVKHETFKQEIRDQVTEEQVDHAAVEYMLQFDCENWNEGSEEKVIKSIIADEKKDTVKLYLSSNPAKAETRLIKECIVDQMKARSGVHLKYMNEKNLTAMSLLSIFDSQVSRDTQLDLYAKAIEETKQPHVE